jgi:hypothetical protein
MTTFDDRERSFEKKFALDQEFQFKSEQRRNKLLGEWAAGKLGLTGPAVEDYVKAVRKADLASKGHEDVFQKIRQDFDAKQVAVPDAELRRAIADFLAAAVAQIEAERKAKLRQRGRPRRFAPSARPGSGSHPGSWGRFDLISMRS